MNDTNEDVERSRRVQALTCPCCTVTHANEGVLLRHLIEMKGKIDLKMRKIGATTKAA